MIFTITEQKKFENLCNRVKEVKAECERSTNNEKREAALKNVWINLMLKAILFANNSERIEEIKKLLPSDHGYLSKAIKLKIKSPYFNN